MEFRRAAELLLVRDRCTNVRGKDLLGQQVHEPKSECHRIPQFYLDANRTSRVWDTGRRTRPCLGKTEVLDLLCCKYWREATAPCLTRRFATVELLPSLAASRRSFLDKFFFFHERDNFTKIVNDSARLHAGKGSSTRVCADAGPNPGRSKSAS